MLIYNMLCQGFTVNIPPFEDKYYYKVKFLKRLYIFLKNIVIR